MIPKHKHNGVDSDKIDPKYIKGFFETVTGYPPTDTPLNWLEQIKIVDDTAVTGEFFLAVYDTVSGSWKQFDNTP